jgi:ribonuclease HI
MICDHHFSTLRLAWADRISPPVYPSRLSHRPGARAGIVSIPPEGDILKYAIQLDFLVTNNIVEYEGLVTGLRLAKDLDIRWLVIRGDSQLVVKQV